MFPLFMERRQLPEAVAEFSDRGFTQYWDPEKAVGREFKERIIQEANGDVVRDAYVLFDQEATWENASNHIVSWGSTVMNKADQLFDHLERLPERPVAQ